MRAAKPSRVAAGIGLVGLAITAALCWTAARSNRSNEHRLVEIQTQQAADVVASAILGIESPLLTAAQIASVTSGNAAQFKRFMTQYTGPGREFVAASLWARSDRSARPIATVGAPSVLVPASTAARRFLAAAFRSSTVVVTGIPKGGLQRVGYAVANRPGRRFAVYVERSIPANRQVPVERDSAFADLNYATYLGSKTTASELATTDVPPASLPLSGYTVRDSIPFGNSTLTLVAGPRGQLGGKLGSDLPWIFLAGGLLLTLATAGAGGQLVRRRADAEQSARTITGLYEQVDTLYGEQRTIAETLQHALLPQSNPSIPSLEVATRYVAGMDGVDIGGDWYSVVLLDDRHFAFVVGDVSGRGIDAAAIMARLRFTIRAYLLEGHPPNVVLEMCSNQLDVGTDGHFATVLVGIGDVESRRVVLANAGHLEPLLVSGAAAGYVKTESGLPLGISAGTYASTVLVMEPGSTLFAFTDGLIERRGEVIDAGLERLAKVATIDSPTLDGLLTVVIADLVRQGPKDDIAILAFRWADTAPVVSLSSSEPIAE